MRDAGLGQCSGMSPERASGTEQRVGAISTPIARLGRLAAMPAAPGLHVITSVGGRLFETHPAAVVVPVVNRHEEFFSSKAPPAGLVGASERGNRERKNAARGRAPRGPRGSGSRAASASPRGMHASTFLYDAQVTRMISVTYLMAYVDGDPRPGGDMRGSRVRWAAPDEIESQSLRLLPPSIQLDSTAHPRVLPPLGAGTGCSTTARPRAEWLEQT